MDEKTLNTTDVAEEIEVGVHSTTLHFPVRVTMVAVNNAPFEYTAAVDEAGHIILTPTTKDMEFTKADTEWENQDYIMPTDDKLSSGDNSSEKTITIELTADMMLENENQQINADIDEIGQCVIYPVEKENSFVSVSIDNSLNLATEEPVVMEEAVESNPETELENKPDEGEVTAEVVEESIEEVEDKDEDGPYSRFEIERELQDLTKQFTIEEDTLKCGYEEEKDYSVEILKQHYENVDVKEVGPWFHITFSKPLDVLTEGKQEATLAVADLEGLLKECQATLDDIRNQIASTKESLNESDDSKAEFKRAVSDFESTLQEAYTDAKKLVELCDKFRLDGAYKDILNKFINNTFDDDFQPSHLLIALGDNVDESVKTETLTEELPELDRQQLITKFMQGELPLFADEGEPTEGMERLFELDNDGSEYYYDPESGCVVYFSKN